MNDVKRSVNNVKGTPAMSSLLTDRFTSFIVSVSSTDCAHCEVSMKFANMGHYIVFSALFKWITGANTFK